MYIGMYLRPADSARPTYYLPIPAYERYAELQAWSKPRKQNTEHLYFSCLVAYFTL